MELNINDLRNLMNGGIGAMREGIENREKILEGIKNLKQNVNKEFMDFKDTLSFYTVDDILNHNYEIFNYSNLYEYFKTGVIEDLLDVLLSEIPIGDIMNFLNQENILYQLYQENLKCDSGDMTSTWDDINELIINYIKNYC